jgi:hypothetical protein
MPGTEEKRPRHNVGVVRVGDPIKPSCAVLDPEVRPCLKYMAGPGVAPRGHDGARTCAATKSPCQAVVLSRRRY